ncbi:hypothetical protein Dsin_022231 [Dipteronia sinensis]|uniref:RNase H type-1 domain-containing protein n=1 Tax=Dipteronia sinensis TaxID=43782 RepID=A0AAE0A2L4_9ROSI|nr:hypothetical protein Dsin_022231 [Dipteronia sinensis]
MKDICCSESMHFQDFLLLYVCCLRLEELEVLGIVWWKVWSYRNLWIHSSVSIDLGCLVQWAFDFLANAPFFAIYLAQSAVISRWIPAEGGVFKINTDAGISGENQCVGVGIVILGEDGLVMVSAAQHLVALVSPPVVESMAILCGIRLALLSNLVPFVVESDALSVIKLVHVGRTPSFDIGIVIHDILSCVEGDLSRLFQFVHRKANMVAHNLAKMALSIKSDLLWVEFVPPFVEALVLEDFPR